MSSGRLLARVLLASIVLDALSSAFWAASLFLPESVFRPIAEWQPALYIGQAIVFGILVPIFVIWMLRLATARGRPGVVAHFLVPVWNLYASPLAMRDLTGSSLPLALTWWWTWVASAVLNNLTLKPLWVQWAFDRRLLLASAELAGDLLSILGAWLLIRLALRARSE